jgi:hypothetical protein
MPGFLKMLEDNMALFSLQPLSLRNTTSSSEHGEWRSEEKLMLRESRPSLCTFSFSLVVFYSSALQMDLLL